MRESDAFGDWVRAPNISAHPDVYELENEAIERDGRLDSGLHEIAPWEGKRVLDVGCGTGFWLPRYAEQAAHVIGVEPDPALLAIAMERIGDHASIDVRHGSAESLPVDDGAIDVMHSRFAYFFGPGCEAGLAEAARVLAPGGVLVAIDNSWSGGDFAELLTAATTGNAAFDPAAADEWWAAQGAVRHEVRGAWAAKSRGELVQILNIEFPPELVADFMADRDASFLTYRFALYEWHSN